MTSGLHIVHCLVIFYAKIISINGIKNVEVFLQMRGGNFKDK